MFRLIQSHHQTDGGETVDCIRLVQDSVKSSVKIIVKFNFNEEEENSWRALWDLGPYEGLCW
jgi:hypothetical protein